jgi:assimilatory nitrate reductase catalytic subunit
VARAEEAAKCRRCGHAFSSRMHVEDLIKVQRELGYRYEVPKGVKRYLQGAHPDRLLHAYKRDLENPHGFSAIPYEEAIRKVAEEIGRIQNTYGASAFASLSGASLTTEKCYLMGKFARVCLKTPYTDYNGRLCMVSAGVANKKAFGVDRAANPWNDILKAEVVWISGANVAECAPITTDYVWQARESGAKVIVVDPRITPIGRTCDLLLPIKPGRDVALFNGILHLMIRNDWIDHSFIENHTLGFDEVAASVEEWTPERTAKITGIAEKGILQAAEWWGTAKTSFLMHACIRYEKGFSQSWHPPPRRHNYRAKP